MHKRRTPYGKSQSIYRCPPLIACVVILLIAGSMSSATPVKAEIATPPRRVNAPYFDGDVRFDEMAIFWFGRVNQTDNYADVRVGFNDEYLRVSLHAFDRRIWYDTTPGADLEAWDGATLYLDLDGDGGGAPDTDDYRFVAQVSNWESRDAYQAAYRGNGSGWVKVDIPVTTTRGHQANGFNNDEDDRGWAVGFYVPFISLGLSGPPPDRTRWGLALAMHDRDSASGSPPISDKHWPEAAEVTRPATWGEVVFGLPSYQSPQAVAEGTTTIRHKLDGATVVDASVGGHTVCGAGTDYWTEWGETSEDFYNSQRSNFNVQNQSNLWDWPCFSKYYVTFPLDSLPSGKAILSATLTIHQFGSSAPDEAKPSLIQVLTVAEEWEDRETTLTWNSAPLAAENVSAAWVDPIHFPGWPGVPRTWDVSLAAAEAYAAGLPLRLALYEADSALHSGKYFVSSDTGDWNYRARPALTVVWGSTVEKTAAPAIAMPGETVTYTLTMAGSGQAITLTDDLPDGVSSPLYRSPGLTYTDHRVQWTGAPAAGSQVTLTYVVTVTAPSRTALWNRAVLAQADGQTDTAAALVLVDPARVYLPLVCRNR